MNRSLVILAMGIAGAVIGTAGLLSYASGADDFREFMLYSDSDRRSFIAECVMQPCEEPPAQMKVVLPAGGDSSVFGEYCRLQEEQQLPLSEHFGEEAVVYTYNIPYEENTGRAELICTPEGLLIGAMYYSSREYYRMYPLGSTEIT